MNDLIGSPSTGRTLCDTAMYVYNSWVRHSGKESQRGRRANNQPQEQHGGQLKKPVPHRIDKITFMGERKGKQQIGDQKMGAHFVMFKPHLNQQRSAECNEQKEIRSFQPRLLYLFLPNETQAVTHHPKLAAINQWVVTLHHPINVLGPLKHFCYYV